MENLSPGRRNSDKRIEERKSPIAQYTLSNSEHLTTAQDSMLCFPGGSDGKDSDCNVGDLDLIPVSERFPGEGNGNPL